MASLNRCDRCGMDVRHDVSNWAYYVCGRCENEGFVGLSVR